MPWLDIFWTPEVLGKIHERGITEEECEELIMSGRVFETSRSSGDPLIQGTVSTGRYLVVVFRYIDKITIEVVTAFTPDED